MLALIAGHLHKRDILNACCVSHEWLELFSRTVLHLNPSELPGDVIPRRFRNLESLGVARCVGSRVVDSSVAALAALTRLTSLSLRGCSKLGAAGIIPLAALTRLQTLDLTGCKGLPTSAIAAMLPTMGPTLRRLTLDKCEALGDDVLHTLGMLSSLTELSLGGCTGIHGVGLSHLSHLSSLVLFNLSGLPHLTDACLQGLQHLSGLEELLLDR